MFDEDRLFRVDDGPKEMRALPIDRQLLQHRAHLGLGGIPADDPSLPARLVLLDDLDQAPIGEITDNQMCDGRQRLLIVERRSQHRPGFGQKPLLLLDALALRDVS